MIVAEDQSRLRVEAVGAAQVIMELTELLVTLIERSMPGARSGEGSDGPQRRRLERHGAVKNFVDRARVLIVVTHDAFSGE